MQFAFILHLCILLYPTFVLAADAAQIGDILIFAGTSSSGKSSLAKALLKIEPDREEEDLDLRHDPHQPRNAAMQEAMIDAALQKALDGKKVLVHMDQSGPFLSRMKVRGMNVPVRSILVFCSFQQLTVRIALRNQSANMKEWRDPLVPFDQYSNLYTAIRDGGKGLETLTLSSLILIYQSQFDDMIAYATKMGNDLPSDAQIKEDREKSLLEFLGKIGVRDGDVRLTLGPLHQGDYTLVVDHSSAEATDRIAAFLHKGAGS